MKREAMDHPKLHELADQITQRGAPAEWAFVIATGIFEHSCFRRSICTRRRCRKVSRAPVARAIGWPGDPDALINALVIHAFSTKARMDWSFTTGASTPIAMFIATRAREPRFADGTVPNLSYATVKERAAWKGGQPAGLPGGHTAGVDSREPEPEPEPESESGHASTFIRRFTADAYTISTFVCLDGRPFMKTSSGEMNRISKRHRSSLSCSGRRIRNAGRELEEKSSACMGQAAARGRDGRAMTAGALVAMQPTSGRGATRTPAL